jgi:cobalamin biosynthesis protein CbiG
MTLVLGIGFRRGTSYGELRALVDATLREASLDAGEVSRIVTVDAKADDPAVGQLAWELGAALSTAAAGDLARQPVPTASVLVERHLGTPSVAEAAVLLTGAELVVSKRSTSRATLAVGRLDESAAPACGVRVVLDEPER